MTGQSPDDLMMPIAAPLPSDFQVSFEFFPPKTDKMQENLWNAIQKLEPLQPRFVSVTYGAGGSTRQRTHDTVMRIMNETSLTPAAHFTCVNHTQEEVKEIVRDYWNKGVRHLVALRGDPPDMEKGYEPTPGGYPYAVDLVRGLKEVADFEISVAAYPEGHPEAPDLDTDIENLKRKIDAGADRAITQFFFEPEMYFRFLDKCEKHNIDVPIVPGILPVTDFKTTARFAGMCGATIPDWMARLYEGLEGNSETSRLIGASVASEMVHALASRGINEFHFYTLNKADHVYAICHMLGIRPEGEADETGAGQ